ncbi:hypothetical protein AAC387_Pa02g3716 [Persea americana]
MQLDRDAYEREMADEANGRDDAIVTHEWVESDLEYTNSNIGSDMMKMMLKEREESEERRRKGMWVEDDNESSIFYVDFPSLPEIPCLSSSSTLSSMSRYSSSSSSSTCSASSSSTSFWTVAKAENEDGVVENHQNREEPGIETAIAASDQPMECMDVLEELGGMDLLDSSSIWDPSSLFPCDTDDEEQQNHHHQEQELKNQEQDQVLSGDGDEKHSEDLAMVFFEWLKSNKESISPEDLRGIKLKRSTIESAARRLGGGKEGMMQLLKLILAWVQNNHLQKRRKREEDIQSMTSSYPFHQQQQNPFPVQVSISNPVFQTPNPDPFQWVSHSPFDPTFSQTPPPASPSIMGYVGDGAFSPGNNHFHCSYSPPPDYQMFGSSSSWSTHLSPYNTTFPNTSSPPFLGFANKYNSGGVQVHGVGEPLVKMAPSATKEARKKRMARQRRIYYHHRHQNHHQHQQQHHLSANPNCTNATPQADSGNWVMWSSAPTPSSSSSPTLISPDASSLRTDPMQPQQRQFSSGRLGWKPEKNLRFLLQKVLKQSDVGNLGRIVLPKKEAETHLPELEARDGIPIAVEDIGTSRVWNMRYRFWPNNKSRMYLLENTADFVRSNGLQEGDFIVLYSDTKCGKYMIRGVKVRKPESKQEIRNPGKMQRNPSIASSSSNADGNSSTCKRTRLSR